MEANAAVGLTLLVAVFCSVAFGVLLGFAITVLTWNFSGIRSWFVGRDAKRPPVSHPRLR